MRMSSSSSGCSVSSRERDISGETTENDGFSVVAPMKETQRFSTAGSSASCWVLLNLCTSSMNSTVWRPDMPSSRRAASTAARTSLTPAVTAESSVNLRLVTWLTTYARVVLPVPGGPHSSSDIGASLSMSLRNGVPGRGEVPLADHLVQRPRPHPHGERRGLLGRPLLRLIEQTLHAIEPTARDNQ